MDDHFPHSSPEVFNRHTLYPSHVTHKSFMQRGGIVSGQFVGTVPNQPDPLFMGNGELVERATNSADLSD